MILVVTTFIAFLTVLIGAIATSNEGNDYLAFKTHYKIWYDMIGYSFLLVFVLLASANIFLMV